MREAEIAQTPLVVLVLSKQVVATHGRRFEAIWLDALIDISGKSLCARHVRNCSWPARDLFSKPRLKVILMSDSRQPVLLVSRPVLVEHG